MTHCSMLCRRCAHNTPKALNAPDPWLPPAAQALVAAQAAAADSEVAAPLLTLAPNDVRDTLHALAGLRTAKLPRRGLGLPAGAEERPFELPADVLHELRSHQITPRGGFGPPAYKEIRRSVYAHGRPREMLPATDVGPCLCSLATGGCDHRCQNRASQQECDAATCPCGKPCANRELSTQEAPPVALFLTETKGWGVKATRRISRGG